MRALVRILSVAAKELRELLRRPVLVSTLIFGPLAIMLLFGIGIGTAVEPPRAIVVVPPGSAGARLIEEHRATFEHFLNVVDYTDDAERARRLLARDAVDAVVIVPPEPYETVADGQQAQLVVLYNEIDPARRNLVPDFVRVLVNDVNRALFVRTAEGRQRALANALRDIDLAVRAIERGDTAAQRGERAGARQELREARAALDRLAEALARLGPPAAPLRPEAARARTRLEEAERQLARAALPATPAGSPRDAPVSLEQVLADLRGLRAALDRLTTLPPEVLIAPLTAETRNLARLQPDIIAYFAPAILALLLQHAAVSLGALALVRERLAGTFKLYIVAPTSNLQLLLGKYLAYTGFVLTIGAVMLGALLSPLLSVPLLGDPRRLALTLVLLTFPSIGLGFALSLLAVSERQAVQFAMLSLLAIVFFSGIALPIDALRAPAIVLSYLLPATYGIDLLQDIMLRGLRGSADFLFALGAMGLAFFVASLALLRWRTRPE